MFSPLARKHMSPQLLDRMDNIMKSKLSAEADPWFDCYPKLNVFGNKVKELTTSKRNNAFRLFLNAHRYQPRDISIKIEECWIVVHGKQDLKQEGFKEFTRRCKIPDYVDPTTLHSTFNKNGLLIVKSNAKPEDSTRDEVEIPIEFQELLVGDVVLLAGGETKSKEENA